MRSSNDGESQLSSRSIAAQAIVGLTVIGVLALAWLALRPGDDGPAERADAVQQPSPAPSVQLPATGASTSTTLTTARPVPVLDAPVLRAGKVRTVDVRAGELVRLAARSEEDDEIHVHGYDISRKAPAGKTVSFSFRATLEGIFEIEFEQAGEPIARLGVSP